MKHVLGVLVIFLAGCSGPVPLDRAILPQHEREYAEMTASPGDNLRDAWYAYRAERESKPVAEIRAADEALPATRNPFDAKRDADAVSRGAVIFRDQCVRCHGTDGRGHGLSILETHPTTDFHGFGTRFAVTLHGGAPRAWFRKITEGFGETVAYPEGPSRAMPAFGETLSREQIWLVVTYLQSLDMYAPSPEPQQTDTK